MTTTTSLQQLMLLVLCFLVTIPYSFAQKRKDKSQQSDEISEEHFINDYSNSLYRLEGLMTGCLVQYKANSKEEYKNAKLWSTNDGQDSVWLYSSSMSKEFDGIRWIYERQMISNLPEEPVYEAIVRIEQITFDSFNVRYFHPPFTPEWEVVKNDENWYQDINFEKLEFNGEEIDIFRTGTTEYIGVSSIYEDKQKKSPYRKDYYIINPEYICYVVMGYKDAEGLIMDTDRDYSGSANFLVRRNPEDMIMLQDETSSSRKKRDRN